MAATRSPQEVFNHHAQALGAEDLEQIVADYSDDAIYVTPAGVQRGKDGTRQAFTKLLGEVPHATWVSRPPSTRTTSCCWSGAPRVAATHPGRLDTFVFRDGLIRVQTVRYSLQSGP
jgi:hypothetical protein